MSLKLFEWALLLFSWQRWIVSTLMGYFYLFLTIFACFIMKKISEGIQTQNLPIHRQTQTTQTESAIEESRSENEYKKDLILGIFGILRNESNFVYTAVPVSNWMPSKDHEKVFSRIIYFFRVREKD